MKSGVVFNQPAESMTNELRLVSKGDSRLQWLAGLFYLDAESDSGGTVDTPDFFFRERTFDPIEAEAMAVYGEVEYAFTDAFSASLGMRYHDEDERIPVFTHPLRFFLTSLISPTILWAMSGGQQQRGSRPYELPSRTDVDTQ